MLSWGERRLGAPPHPTTTSELSSGIFQINLSSSPLPALFGFVWVSLFKHTDKHKQDSSPGAAIILPENSVNRRQPALPLLSVCVALAQEGAPAPGRARLLVLRPRGCEPPREGRGAEPFSLRPPRLCPQAGGPECTQPLPRSCHCTRCILSVRHLRVFFCGTWEPRSQHLSWKVGTVVASDPHLMGSYLIFT